MAGLPFHPPAGGWGSPSSSPGSARLSRARRAEAKEATCRVSAALWEWRPGLLEERWPRPQVGRRAEGSQNEPRPQPGMRVRGLRWAQVTGSGGRASVCLWAGPGDGLDTQKAPPCATPRFQIPTRQTKLLDLSQPWTRGKVGNDFTWPLPDRLPPAQCPDSVMSRQNSQNTFHLESTPSLQLL